MWRTKMSMSIVIIVLLLVANSSNSENLFNEKEFKSFTSDKKAYRIGDTVTILIVERIAAESRAKTQAGKSLEFTGSASDQTSFPKLQASLQGSSGGEAVTSRNGFIAGQITVTVLDVNKLGHLVVDGQQKIMVNGEEQSIKVEGTLRQEDILANNTALSTRLTNAKIEFVGIGIVGDAQKKSLLATVLGWLGLL